MIGKKSMKYVICFMLICQFLLVSCNKVEEKEVDTPEVEDIEKQENEDKPSSELWNRNIFMYNVDIPYELPEFTPNVQSYKIKEDLSDLHNAGQYVGFTEKQRKTLYEDGFVILKPNNSVLQMHQVYESNKYAESPSFITVDSILHVYHVFYDNSLKYVELTSLYDKLKDLSKLMLEKSIGYYNNPKYENLKDELKFIASYFLTANKLMDIDVDSLDIPDEISLMAEREIILIEEARDFEESPILGKDLDYSQFVVRGHYAGNEQLIKYFKTMMWYGQCGFPVFDETSSKKELDIDNVVKSMIVTSIVFSNEEIFENYENIYSITSLYTGLSDDLGIFEYRDLITKVYGENPDINIYKDKSYYDKLLEEALLLPEPKIQPEYTEVSAPAGRQFRFMGQRYSFDAETMQNLIKAQERPIPSGLDVISAFDNKRAEELLDIYYKPKELWSDYEKYLGIMRKKEKQITDDEWKSDLYNGWLWSITSAAVSYENTEGMPKFMRSQKWTDKNINTALGSFAELKHDSILYKKQSGAEMGGGGLPNIPYNYVEPNVELYAKLKWLTENTMENLKVRDMLDERTGEVLDSILEMVDTLLTVSVKELTNENISEEENTRLFVYGGRIDYIIQSFSNLIREAGINDDDKYTSALIADVSTVAPDAHVDKGHYLEIGNGLPCEIYVICNTNDKNYLARGAVFNYYEFLSDKRLTDDEWYNLLGIKKMVHYYDKEKDEYFTHELYDENGNKTVGDDVDYYEDIQIGTPSHKLPSKPDWTKGFISQEENNVTTDRDVIIEW